MSSRNADDFTYELQKAVVWVRVVDLFSRLSRPKLTLFLLNKSKEEMCSFTLVA